MFQAGPQPKFKGQEQDAPGLECEMDPLPDYGLESYRGTGKLQDKIAVITGTTPIITLVCLIIEKRLLRWRFRYWTCCCFSICT